MNWTEITVNVPQEFCDTAAAIANMTVPYGCGKTTLLKLIAGEHSITKLDSDEDSYFTVSGTPIIGVLSQITFKDDSVTLLEEVRSAYSDILSLKSELHEVQRKMEEEQSDENIKNYTNLLEIEAASNLVYLLGIVVILFLLVNITIKLSKYDNDIRTIIQNFGINVFLEEQKNEENKD